MFRGPDEEEKDDQRLEDELSGISMEECPEQWGLDLPGLYIIPEAWSGPRRLDEIMGKTLDAVLDLLKAEAGGIYLLDKDAGELVLCVWRGLSDEFVEEMARLKVGEGISGRVLEGRTPILVESVSTDERSFETQEAIDKEGLHSGICVPLVDGDKVLGVINVVTHAKREFTSEEATLLSTMARQIAVALENVRLREDVARKVRELTALYNVSAEVAGQLEIEQLLQSIVEHAISLLGASAGGIYLYDPAEGELELRVASQQYHAFVGKRPALGEGVCGKVAQSGQPLLVDNFQQWEGGSPLWQGETPIGGVLAVPFKRGGDVVGVLLLTHAPGKTFQETDVRPVTLFANEAAIAIENARLYERERKKVAQLKAINLATREMARLLDSEQLLLQVAKAVQEALHCYNSNIFLMENGQLVLVAGHGGYEDGEPPLGASLKVGQGIIGSAAKAGEPLLVNDVDQDRRYQFCEALPRTKSELAVPIKRGEAVIGVLDVQGLERFAFDKTDLEVLLTLADQLSIAIEKAHLMQKLSQEKRSMERLLEGLADGLFTTDEKRRILTLNKAAETLTGYRREDVIGRFCGEVLARSDARNRQACEYDCPLVRTLQGSQALLPPAKIECMKAKDGRPLQVEGVITPLTDEGHQRRSLAVAVWDISGEDGLRRQKDEFVSLVSHEFRAPLTNIKVAAQTGLKGIARSSGEQRRLFEIIDRESLRLTQLVEDILRVSELEGGRLKPQIRKHDLVSLAQRALELANVRRFERTFELWVESQSLPVLADEEWTLTTFSNLMENAIKYSPPGSRVKIALEKQDDEFAVVHISDQGRGIPAADLQKVFEKFYRGDAADNQSCYGYGLGLYFAKILVQGQGGTISVRSQVGEGSTFSFTLPTAV